MERSFLIERNLRDQPPPEDLLQWAGHDLYVSLVLSAVERAFPGLARGCWNGSSIRAVANLIVYCYGRGIYSSYEVASMAGVNRRLLGQFGDEPPDWDAVRRFRQTHHGLIQCALTELFRGVWKFHSQKNTDGDGELIELNRVGNAGRRNRRPISNSKRRPGFVKPCSMTASPSMTKNLAVAVAVSFRVGRKAPF